MSRTFAVLFPGQGAQVVGMAKQACEGFQEAQRLYDRAAEVLGFDLARVCFEGPQEELNRTDLCQLALFVGSLAVLAAFRQARGARIDEAAAAAGLSLGEYTALCYAGALGFEEGLRIVRLRGEKMHEACEAEPGTMASILGLDRDGVRQACERAGGLVVPANYNSPGQLVISGQSEAVKRACEAARELGARRAVPLRVAGAFHSPLMEPAEEALRSELQRVSFHEARLPVIANASARAVRHPEEVREALGRQLTSPVLWEASMRALRQREVDLVLELGPGTVLSGLMRRIDRAATAVSVQSPDEFEAAWEQLATN